jgi:hypothetical protein
MNPSTLAENAVFQIQVVLVGVKETDDLCRWEASTSTPPIHLHGVMLS